MPRLSGSKAEHTTIEEVRVGCTKEALDIVGDHGLAVNDVTESFGRFLKFYVLSTVSEDLPPARDAFQVMFAAQRRLNSVKYPPMISVRNKRDELYNDLLSLLKSKDLHWEAEEVQSGTATRAIQTLRDALWYVDGSHSTLIERGCTIPALFRQFSGYNKSEQHKHRKRVPSSLSREVLLSHSQALFTTLHNPFWSRPLWSAHSSQPITPESLAKTTPPSGSASSLSPSSSSSMCSSSGGQSSGKQNVISQFLPPLPTVTLSRSSTSKQGGARVLTSKECLEQLAAKERKKQQEKEEKEN